MNVNGRPGPAMALPCWDGGAEPKWVSWVLWCPLE